MTQQTDEMDAFEKWWNAPHEDGDGALNCDVYCQTCDMYDGRHIWRAATAAAAERPCPHIYTGNDGTSHCTLAAGDAEEITRLKAANHSLHSTLERIAKSMERELLLASIGTKYMVEDKLEKEDDAYGN